MNLIHLVAVSYHQDRESETQVSLLFFQHLIREQLLIQTLQGNLNSFPQCCLVSKYLQALKNDHLIDVITLQSWCI